MKSKGIILCTSLLLFGCSTSNPLMQGRVASSNYYSKIEFTTAKALILVPCEMNGHTKNFIFDSGATVTTVQRDSIFGEIVEVHGASNRTVENGSETIKSLRIGNVDFINTFASNEKLGTLKENIPKFGGILGRPIINKSNWLIDYPNRTIEVSNRDLSSDNFKDIQLDKTTNAPKTVVEIDDNKYKAIIDLGSTSNFNVPKGTELANHLLQTYSFKVSERQRYTVGGTELITEQIGVVPKLMIGDIEFKGVEVNINRSSQIRLGMRFFERCVIYIDNTNNRYRVKRQS